MNESLQSLHYLRWRSRSACAPLITAMVLLATAYSNTVSAKAGTSVRQEAARATITGTVKDTKGDPLPGVTVKVKGAAGGTNTDVKGVYKLKVPEGEVTLVFSFLGFETKEVKVSGQTVVDVSLKENVTTLKDVVVNVGYGTAKRSQVTGSVATITGAELQDIPAPNIASALRNRIAGVSVDANSGRPGSSISLNIRNSPVSGGGVAGVTDEPLYVIDNIVVGKGTFDAIDLSMVENITFLKDASAAIYGAAGAKGVVLVTTKRGKDGKISVSYNGYYGTTDMATKPKMLSAYDQAVLINDGFKYSTTATATSFFTDAELDSLKSFPSRSWLDELWKASTTQKHNISISGGSEKVTFFAGGSYSNENGNYAGIKYDKYSFRTGINTTINKSLKATIDFSLDNSVKSSQNSFSEDDQNFYRGLLTTPAWVPIEINGMPVNFSNATANDKRNPLAIIRSGYLQSSKNYGARINAQINYSPEKLRGFTATLQISPSISNSRSNTYQPPYKVYNFVRRGNNNAFFSDQLTTSPFTESITTTTARLAPGLSSGNNYQATLRLMYGRTLGKHTFSLMVAPEQSEGYTENLNARWSNQRIPGVSELWAFDQTTLTLDGRTISESIKRSLPMRASYNYGGKYVLDFVGRFDASNNFAKGKVWGFFPSIGGAWVMSEENFFKNAVPFVNYFKLKGNFGILGDDRVSSTMWQDRYAVDLNGYSFGETLLPGANPKEIANPNITWEKARIWGTGMEASLFGNRLNLGIDYYHRVNYDMFDKNANASYPAYFGQIAPVDNYMRSRAWGTEFSIGYNDKLTRDLSFSTSVNFGFTNQVNEVSHYELTKLFYNTPPDWLLNVGTNSRLYDSNNYGLVSKGILQTQADVDALLDRYPNYTINGKVPEVGWMYYEDTDGDGIITEMDQVQMYKHVNPILAMGISLGVRYKAFDLSTNINAKLGGKAFYDSYSTEEATINRNVGAFWKDHWTPENPGAKYPRVDDPGIASGWQSTYWATNGTMIRINTMTLGYKIPQQAAQRIGLNNLRLLVTGNNLWSIINPIKNKDPYSKYLYDYPTLRTISLGVNLGL